MIYLEKIPETEVLFLSVAGSEILLTDGENIVARQECESANQAARLVFEQHETMVFDGKSVRERGGHFPRVLLETGEGSNNDHLHAQSHSG